VLVKGESVVLVKLANLDLCNFYIVFIVSCSFSSYFSVVIRVIDLMCTAVDAANLYATTMAWSEIDHFIYLEKSQSPLLAGTHAGCHRVHSTIICCQATMHAATIQSEPAD
jgi:hypothetical protein